MLQILYSIRSERFLTEQLDCNILFRWFVGMDMDEPVWVPTVFTKNRDRLLTQAIARSFFSRVVERAGASVGRAFHGRRDVDRGVGQPEEFSAGSFPVTITATDGGGALVQSTQVTLTVNPAAAQDFTISASPASRTIKRGRSAAYSVSVAVSGGFGEVVTFSVTGLPATASAVFTPSSVTGSGTSTLSIGTSNGTPKGTYTLTITGTSTSKTHAATVTLKVQ